MAVECANDQSDHFSLTRWYVGIEPQRAGAFGGCMWTLAAIALVLFVHGDFLGPTGFTLFECWMIGSGCLGAPLLVSRLLGRALRPGMCLVFSALLAGAAILLTILFGTGQLHVDVLVEAFALIMPESMAIHLVNAADTLTRVEIAVEQARAEERARGDKRLEAALTAAMAEQTRALKQAFIRGFIERDKRIYEFDLERILDGGTDEELVQLGERVRARLVLRTSGQIVRSNGSAVLKLLPDQPPQPEEG